MKMSMSRALTELSDGEGTVAFGPLAVGVYYVRLTGHLSSKLGIECAVQLRQQLGTGRGVHFFVDGALAKGVAFAARSAVMRALLANRQQLNSITVVVAVGSSARARSMVAMLGRPNLVTDSAEVFQTHLHEAVPSARTKLAPTSGTMRAARSQRPRARSLRPRARSA
jgi:hypothetical protein